ncbi:hypothetical protein L3Q82_014568 [Scortum barcoo]|uniref:Uncharacterized protein n=1 Tax=Scortum barcoo TaxID=214431 RepID=A0ACB8VXC8_9TELE|nr:hypothetical protein L3Q82_014568 [Scortum barcoo]
MTLLLLASSQMGTTESTEDLFRTLRTGACGTNLQINAGKTKELVVDFRRQPYFSACTVQGKSKQGGWRVRRRDSGMGGGRPGGTGLGQAGLEEVRKAEPFEHGRLAQGPTTTWNCGLGGWLYWGLGCQAGWKLAGKAEPRLDSAGGRSWNWAASWGLKLAWRAGLDRRLKTRLG